MAKLSAHFDSEEFRCKDGSMHPIDPDLIAMLEEIHAHFGAAISITSGYRSPAYNKRIGGASRSQHCLGRAADIKVSGVAPATVYAYADARFPDCGLGLYRSWVHIDSRGSRARWGSK